MAATLESIDRRNPIAVCLIALLIAASALADERVGRRPASEETVIARVDGQPIYERDLNRELAPAAKLLDPQAVMPTEVRKRALDQLIDRRLVQKYLIREQLAASEQDVDLEVGRMKKRLEGQEKKLADYLKSSGLTEVELRREIRWRLSWQKYLAGQLTDENLQKYFARYSREFDGTELKVAHLLIKPANSADPLSVEEAQHKAAAIRADIEGGKLSFADACRQHSQAPTAKDGGNIGFIGRHEPMPEAFSAAAFALEKDQVSQPVQTKFGIHLIQVLETKPGQKTWQECQPELKSAVTQYLFRWMADKERKTAQVEVVREK